MVERRDAVSGGIIRIIQDTDAGVFPLQTREALRQISRHHIDLKDPVFVERPNGGVDDPHPVHADQRLWRMERRGTQPAAEARRHDKRFLCGIHRRPPASPGGSSSQNRRENSSAYRYWAAAS